MAGSFGRGRMSVAPGSVSNASAARLAAKQAELQALQSLRNESATLAQEMSKLGDRVDTLVQGGSAVASVMASWQGVFRAIQIAQSTSQTLLTAAAMAASQALDKEEEERQVPDAVVRIPIQQARE
ncbi:DASH complex subunit dad2 [Malassezia vespertilionis]|uniref:DASH complex subunit dad2 n=1 Tax=Malassezia vespertilionis TaxID=2020962 RepID=UPI0024B15027|nr:DASH complex subunit dad2 [Malassezia vespertilionis]WFD08488.1 DASH complex subunit dad2 [Malassezia vespertilionis]